MNDVEVIATNNTRMYHWSLTRCENLTMTAVSSGSLPPNCLNTPSNTGIRKATSASSTIVAKVITIVG